MNTIARHSCVAFAMSLATATALPARAQESSLDAAAAQMADALAHSKHKTVVVFDFFGPDGRLTALGEKLADDFSNALSAANRALRVEDRRHIASAISKGQYAPDVVHNPEFESFLAGELKTDSFVSGSISLQGKDLTVVVKSRNAKDWKKVTSVNFSLSLTDDVQELLAKTVADAPVPPYLDPDNKEYSPAHCIYCPRADYTDEAMRSKIQGVVILEAVLAADGQIRDLRVLKPLPQGLTEAAIQAVRKWKLSPATGPDGKPLATRQMILVSFQLG
jgi:TonB family protein